jgi:hypothetical protein
MEKDRILISQDNVLFKEICSDLEQFKHGLNKLQTHYEALEIEGFSDEAFKEIVFHGTNEIKKRFEKNIASEIENLGVKNTLIKENILSGSEALLNNFLLCVQEIKSFRPTKYGNREYCLELRSISFGRNGFYLSNDDKEYILESKCRIYIETDDEHKLYEKLMKLIDIANDIDKHLDEIKFTTNAYHDKLITIRQVFLNSKDGKYEINPKSVSYALNWATNHKAFRKNLFGKGKVG